MHTNLVLLAYRPTILVRSDRKKLIVLTEAHLSLKLVLVEGAVHRDPILTAGILEGKEIKRKVVAWLKEGFDI